MKKTSWSDILQISTLVISVLSILIAFLAYKQSIDASKPKVEVSISTSEKEAVAWFKTYNVCYIPETGTYHVVYDLPQLFVIANNGGLDVSLLAVEYRGFSEKFLPAVDQIAGYSLSDDKDKMLYFPLDIPTGSGQMIYLKSTTESWQTEQISQALLYDYLEERKPTDEYWIFKFSDGSSIVKEMPKYEIILPSVIEDCP